MLVSAIAPPGDQGKVTSYKEAWGKLRIGSRAMLTTAADNARHSQNSLIRRIYKYADKITKSRVYQSFPSAFVCLKYPEIVYHLVYRTADIDTKVLISMAAYQVPRSVRLCKDYARATSTLTLSVKQPLSVAAFREQHVDNNPIRRRISWGTTTGPLPRPWEVAEYSYMVQYETTFPTADTRNPHDPTDPLRPEKDFCFEDRRLDLHPPKGPDIKELMGHAWLLSLGYIKHDTVSGDEHNIDAWSTYQLRKTDGSLLEFRTTEAGDPGGLDFDSIEDFHGRDVTSKVKHDGYGFIEVGDAKES
ncbi:hypothetical protein HDU90_004326 [Geranomyces variabilis]|nr:hypothetical protein HDU90_004326 [Geranomyces variabilis]